MQTQARPAEDASYRLPRTVLPSRYTLTLTPDLANATFAGTVAIDVRVVEPVNEIVLNAAELEIQQATIAGQSGTVTLRPDDERATIALSSPIQPGTYTLDLAFTGILNDKLHGFYRSTFKDSNGVEQVIATTQFESTDARRAFPCWDEPDFKAVFQTTLIVPDDLMAISNGREEKTEPAGPGKKAVTFGETMPMSTYLVAFLVGPFEATPEVMIQGDIPLRVITPRGKLHLAQFALGIGKFATEYFAEWTGIPYPADKLDLIAVPDFAFGAMENLGAVTFRETALLADEAKASRVELERIADVVAHEIGHMWFGDLVTMKWWNGVWLKEAFATFMEVKAVDAWKPEWKRWDSFAMSRSAAMGVDSLKNTRTVEFPVRRPDEATGMYDLITYEKGCSLNRMIEQFLGEETFRRGLNIYLTKHRHANAETTDLWDALEAGSEQPVRKIMDSWIFQAGFPVVSVEPSAAGVRLSQQQFRLAGQPDATTWEVPVILRVETPDGSANRKVLVSGDSVEVDLPEGWTRVIANAGSSGFYRVRYAPDLLANLRADLAALTATERYNLIDDTWAATVAGLSSVSDFLNLADAFKDVPDDNVWSRIASAYGYLKRAADKALHPAIEARLQALAANQAARLGWEPAAGEDELTGQLRATILGALGTVGNDPATQAEAKRRLDQYHADGSGLDRNLVGAAVGIVAYAGDAAQYADYEQRYRDASASATASPQEVMRYLTALPGFRHRDLVERTLAMTLNGDVRTQNAAFVLAGALANPAAPDLAWEFVKANWKTFVERYPANNIPRIANGLSSIFDARIAEDARAFFAANPYPEGERSIRQDLERQQIAVQFKEREADNLKTLFGA